MADAAPSWAKVNASKVMLDVFNPPDDGKPSWARTVAAAPSEPAWAKPAAPAPTWAAAAKDEPSLLDKAINIVPDYGKKLIEAAPAGMDAAIKGGGKLVANVAAPFMKQESLDKAQKVGFYDPKESPVKEYAQAAYGGIMAPLAPALEAITGAAKTGAKAAGVPEKVVGKAGDIANTAMDVLGVAGIPGIKGARGAKAEIPKVEPKLEAPIADAGRTVDPSGAVHIVDPKTGKLVQAGWAAAKEVPSAEPSVPAPTKRFTGTADSEMAKPVPVAGALPTRASDELFKLSNRDEVRRTEYVKSLKQIKDVPNEMWEKLYAQKDNPALPRTPEEQALYDTHIKAVADRSEALIKEFKQSGIDFGDTGGAPRRVKGMNPLVERIYGNKAPTGGGRRSISTFSPALQGRTMWALPGKTGARQIVYVEDGKLFSNGEPVGEIMGKDTKPGTGVETSLGKLQQATTAEIEGATKLDYHKNLLANEYLRVQSLERAKDSKDFLDWLKTNPEFTKYATLNKGVETPADWRSVPDVRTFEGWKFDPRLAETIEDYMGNIKSPEEYSNAVLNVAKAAKASIFFNPIRHMINATNMFATSKGAFGTLRDAPNTPMALMRATKSVLTQDKAFRDMAKEGLSLPSMRNTAAQFNKQLTRAMGLAAQREPKGMAKLAKEWGYNSTAGMTKALLSGSNKLLWAYSDILAMTRVNEYMARGMSKAEAIERVEKVMANYRIPSRVAGSRGLSKILQDPRVTMFGRYDYNRFANLTGMIKRAASKDPGAWEARDQLLALAVLTTLGYTAIDKWIQGKTGNENAHQDMGGFSSMINTGKDLVEGKKSPAQAIQSTFAPGFLSTPIEALTGQNMYTGKPIAQRGDWNSFVEDPNMTDAARMGFDVARYAGDKFMPVADTDRYLTGNMTPAEFWLSQVGTKVPSDDQLTSATKAEKYARGASKSAAKKRPEWVP